MSVAPRWKRRADEIAEAIGDELSINGTVSIGNDINLSVATISALAIAITDVLNPTDIAAAMYALTMPVSVVSTNTTPVHVQVRNVAGGFTAMGSDISTSMKLTAQPVSISDTVDVKTATGESVAITGTVNANVGGVTLPISNPNNITVPVVNSGNITVPVSLGGVTVPVRASANGTGQNSGGVNVLVSVNPTHSVTVPVSVGSATVPVSVSSGLTVPASVASNLTVPVAVGSATVPVAVGSVTVPVVNTSSVVVPVENTNNVTVPVTAGGTLDVNIKTIDVNARTQFHDAMETALNEATDINTLEQSGFYYGTVISYSTTYVRVKDVDGGIYDAGVVIISGTLESVMRSSASTDILSRLIGVRVATESSDYKTTPRSWKTVETYSRGFVNGVVGTPTIGHIIGANNQVTQGWKIRAFDGNVILNQRLYDDGEQSTTNSALVNKYYGTKVVFHGGSGSTTWFPEHVPIP